jgi:hypothetical protein
MIPQQSTNTIPKVIVQTSSNKILSDNWEHKHFTSDNIDDFFKEHKSDEFPDMLEKYKITPDLFKYYYLYLYGGFYIDNAIVLHTSMDTVAKTYGFVSVLSINENSIFTGIIGCSTKNPIIYKVLKLVYDTPDSIVGAEMYKFAHDTTNADANTDTNKYDFSIKLYKELTNESRYFANTFDTDETGNINLDSKLFTHYFKNKMVPLRYVKPTSISETKIAITFSFPDKLMDVFTNGIRQNTIFFYELLSNIGYDVYMIVPDRDYESTQKIGFWNNGSIKYLKLSQLTSFGFHLVVQFGFQIEEYILDFLKASRIRTVFYNCGNKYFIESESCLYNKSADALDFQYNSFNYHHFDQLWLIPQMMNTCLHYMKILYRSDTIEVPFIWSPSMSELYEKELGRSIQYKNRGICKTVSIFEPNLSIIKWSIPCVLICENAHRTITDKNLIKHVYVTNMNPNTSTNDLPNVKVVNKMVKSLDIFVNKKLSIEGRYNSLYFMAQHSDIAVSHQMENPLNYLYLDLAWMGWPIIHNAHLCKDVGYYYEGFNYEEGSEVLKRVILTHDDNAEEYMKRNRSVIHKYLPTNKYLQEQYISLINKLL